ncbi:myosin D [Plasmodium vivax North Korean]|uniref:Myosin D n=1 Tax=Plasmodium vivax North Korean TaxID=1035514 RepID=A0A0J9TLQ7_PLAVI|nr:myosin D [Plasmodium vivax North Korean]
MASLQLKSNETFYYSNVSNAGEGPTSGAGAPKGEESSERKDVEMKFHSDKHVWCFYNDMYKKMEVCGFSPSGKTYTLKRKGETLENVPAEKVTPCLKEHIQLDSENNIDIIQLNEPNVIENLQNRYAKNKIYTFHASLLLAINPYKQIPGLYGEESMHRYLSKFGKGSGGGSESGSSGAHIYDIGNLAYKNMVLKGKRQTIVVSGHSGSGKTENCKILFKYFHYMFFHRSGVAAAAEAAAEGGEAGVAAAAAGGDATGQRIDKLIYINSIIEAMSNAKTIKNNNSSRCGRINELLFEERRRRTDETIFNHCFTNMKIRILLLEINRCIRHNKGERNFHVFYEIVRGLTDAELSQRGLVRDVHRYRLLRCADHGEDIPTGESALEEERKDQKNFHHLMDGLRYIQYDEGRISQFVDVVAGVIHLGEIDPGGEGQEEGAGEEEGVGGEESNLGGSPNADSYQNACFCLGLPLAELQSTIRFKSIHVSGERIRTQRSRDNAMNTLHSLIKVIYKNLFCKLVGDINRTHLSGEESEEVMNESAQVRSNHTISILDLYGFEELASNDFEQLCINLANEKLNNYYILNEVEKEKLIHREENILWREVPIPNYKDTILFVEKLFLSLDDITKLNSCGQKKVDEDFFSYLLQSERSYLEKGTYGFVSSRDGSYTDRRHGVRRNVFFVRHYAGCVAYTVSGWIGKNSDRVEAEIGELIARSGNWFLGGEATVGGGGTMENILSVSKKYIKELDKLFSNMKETDLHYIRCILPNEQMRRDNLKRRLIYTQLKQCGAIEMVKIVNRGLSHKVLKGEFLNRCRRDVPKELQHCRDDDIAYYFMRLFDEANSFKVGKNYIFMGSGVYTEVHGYLYGDHLHQMGRHHLPLMEERKKKILKEINTRRFRRSVWVVQIHNWLSTHYRTYLQKKKRMKEKACDYMFKVYLIFKTVMGLGTDTYMPLPIHCIGQHPLYKNIFIAVEGDLSVRIFSYPTLDSIKRFLRRKIHLMKRGSGDIPSTYLPQLHRSRRFGGPSGECALLRRIHKEEYIEQEVCANPSFKILKVAFLPTSLSHFVCLSYEQRGREHYLLVTLVNCCSKPTYNYTTKIRITSVIESAQFWKFLLQTGGDSLAGATEPVAVGRRCPGDQNEEKKKHVESYLSTLQISPISNSLVVIHGACLLSLVQIHHYSLGSSDVCLREYERRFLRVAFSLICFEVFSHVCEEHLGRLSPDLKHRLVVDELFGRGEKRSNIEEGSNIEERSNTQICLNGSGDSDTSAHLAGPLDEVKKQPDEATPQEPPRQCSLYAFSPRGEIYLLTNGERGGSSGELFRHGPWGVRKLAVRRRSAGEGAAWEGATGEKATEEGATEEGATEEGATEEGATGEGATGEGATGGLPPPCSYYGVFSMNISHFYKQEYHKSFVTLRPSIQATIRKYARAGREPVTGVSGSSRIRSGINSMSSRMSKSLFPDVCVLREWTGSGFEGVQRECLYYSLRNGGEAMTLCRGEGRPSPPPDST